MPIRRKLRLLMDTGVISGGWTPMRISSLLLWLKSDVGLYQDSAKTTPATADGAIVGAWADQSGNGHDLLQAGADSLKPTLQNAVGDLINGHPVVRFDGADDRLRTALGLTGDVVFSIGLVLARSRAQTEIFWGMGANAANAGIGNGWGAAGYFNIFQYGSGESRYISSLTSPVIMISLRTSAPALDLWINNIAGTDTGAVAAANIVLDQFELGGLNATVPAQITITELVAKNGVFTSQERIQLQQYFSRKYGITLS